jgi:hypothetical protein
MAYLPDDILRKPELLMAVPQLAFTCRRLLETWDGGYCWRVLAARLEAAPQVRDVQQNHIGNADVRVTRSVSGMCIYDVRLTYSRDDYGRGLVRYGKHNPLIGLGVEVIARVPDLERRMWGTIANAADARATCLEILARGRYKCSLVAPMTVPLFVYDIKLSCGMPGCTWACPKHEARCADYVVKHHAALMAYATGDSLDICGCLPGVLRCLRME